jgi:hypothetical protein
LDKICLRREITDLTSNSTGPLESVAVLGLDRVLREAYNTGILPFWFVSTTYHIVPCGI